ncbi:MAG TPA: phosphoglycerate mutase [Dokdonella sp.]|jgi:hypothetical protein|nr:phosphoglycerate mutase [Dokdonella sp.]
MITAILLLPEWKRCAASPGVAEGVLAGWCARGDHLPAVEPGDAMLRGLLDWPGNAMPVAALSRQFDAGDAAGFAWLRADPAHIRADMSTARMLACGELGLSPAECASIEAGLKPLFGDAGFEFEACRTDRWYVRAPSASDLPSAASPDEVIGDDLKLHFPTGPAGRRWRRLSNEAQIILHNHPVNAARARRGAVGVNSLWFWGAGLLPDFVRAGVCGVLSPRAEIRALAALAGVSSGPLEPATFEAALASPAAESPLLVDLVDQRAQALEAGWLQPLQAALRQRRVGRIELRFASGERLRVKDSHRLRFWRRLRGLRS